MDPAASPSIHVFGENSLLEAYIHKGSQTHSCVVLHQLNYGLQHRTYKPLLEACIQMFNKEKMNK